MDLLVGMRLHALIFAAAMAVPVVALDYDPKVKRLMCTLEQAEYCVPINRAEARAVASLAERALDQRQSIAANLSGHAATLAERALRNVDVALSVAGRRG